MTLSFGAQVAEWAHAVEGALEVIFRESVQELVEEMDLLLVQTVYDQPISPSGYKRTGFLRASLVASETAMPQLVRDNPGVPIPADLGDVMLVIAGADLGSTVYLGYTANYAAFVHYSANGERGRPWVTMAAQRWPIIVDRVAARVQARLGL
jgi:hypothetical protein